MMKTIYLFLFILFCHFSANSQQPIYAYETNFFEEFMANEGKKYLPKNEDEGILWKELIRKLKRDSKDNPKVQEALGAYYLHNKNNLKQASKWYLKLAKQGNLKAYITLGKEYQEAGKPIKAHFYYQMAKNKGYNSEKLRDLEYRFLNNITLEELIMVAKKGATEAMFLLGEHYGFKNNAYAIKWYEKAAKKGHKMAQHNLAYIYQGLYKVEEAIYWYKQFLSSTESVKEDWEFWRELAEAYVKSENHSHFIALLHNSFPENVWFFSDDYETRFHQPDVGWDFSQDTLALRLAYIKETKSKETGEVYFEKIERIIPLNTITESYTFEFHFGQADWKYKGVHYMYFDVSEDCNYSTDENCKGAKTKIYLLDPTDWSKSITDGTMETGGHTMEWNHFWFPTSKKAGKKLDQLFRELL